jgi:tetratricopeptide (TPR) repeat protein
LFGDWLACFIFVRIKISLQTIIPFFLFITVLLVYSLTLSPSVNFGDGGLLIAAAHTLGIPYPPGYPLFVLLGHLFSKIPVNSIAWRINFMSAFFGSLTILLFYLSLLKIGVKKEASLCASFFLAFSFSFWYYNLITEVFSLNNFFLVLLVFLAFTWFKKLKEVYLNLLAFLFGLSLTNHQSLIFTLPAFISLFFVVKRKIRVFPKIFLFILGLSLYLVLPVLAARNPPLNWGNPKTLAGLLNLVLRREFGTFRLTDVPGGSRLTSLKVYLSFLGENFGALGIFFGLLGLVALFKKRKIFWFLLTIFLFTGPFFVLLLKIPFYAEIRKPLLERFFLLSTIVFGFFIGLGLDSLLDLRSKQIIKKFLFVLVLSFFISPLFLNFFKVNQRENSFYYFYGLNLLKTLPKDSLFLLSGDVTASILTYLQVVEGRRTDLYLLNYSLLPQKWYYQQIRKRHPELFLPRKEALTGGDLVQLCQMKRPVFIFPLYETHKGILENCSFIQKGLVVQLFPKEYVFNFEKEAQENRDFWQTYIGKDKLFWGLDKSLEERRILYFYAAARVGLAEIYLKDGKPDKGIEELGAARLISRDFTPATNALAMMRAQRERIWEAIQMEEEAVKLSPEDFLAHRNLGILLADKDNKRAVRHLEKYLKLRPRAQDRDLVLKMITDLSSKI